MSEFIAFEFLPHKKREVRIAKYELVEDKSTTIICIWNLTQIWQITMYAFITLKLIGSALGCGLAH